MTYAAMQRNFYDKRSLIYPAKGDRHVWPFVRALAATQSIAELPGAGPAEQAQMTDRLRGLWRYRDRAGAYESLPRSPYGPGGHVYYDDNEWIGLELLRRHAVTREPVLLQRARELLRLVIRGWDRSARHCPGGVVWTPERHFYQRGTVTNGPGAQLAAGIYQQTRDRRALGWAMRMYAWAEACMLDSSLGLYEDHLRRDGSRDRTIWSYNQGSMIAAALALYRATGQRWYLDTASLRAARAFDYFEDSRLNSEPPYFLAIYFRNLLAYDTAAGGTSFRESLQRYADQAWDQFRDPRTGIFNRGKQHERLLRQAGMVEIYALLAGS